MKNGADWIESVDVFLFNKNHNKLNIFNYLLLTLDKLKNLYLCLMFLLFRQMMR